MFPAEGIQLEMGFSTVSHLEKNMAGRKSLFVFTPTKQTSLKASKSSMDRQHTDKQNLKGIKSWVKKT